MCSPFAPIVFRLLGGHKVAASKLRNEGRHRGPVEIAAVAVVWAFNVPVQASDLTTRAAGLVEIDCDDAASFRSWSKRQLFHVIDSLAVAADKVRAGTMTKGDFNDLEMSVGVNFNETGVLMSPSLRYRH